MMNATAAELGPQRDKAQTTRELGSFRTGCAPCGRAQTSLLRSAAACRRFRQQVLHVLRAMSRCQAALTTGDALQTPSRQFLMYFISRFGPTSAPKIFP